MGLSFGQRHDHLLSFMDYATLMNISPLEMFAVSMANCSLDAYKPGCGVSWTEYDWQVPDRPSRMMLAQRLYQAEQMIGNYLKTPVGPTYIKGEMHTAHWVNKRRRHVPFNYTPSVYSGPMLKIQTNYRNVIKTGTRVMTRIGQNLPQKRSFVDIRHWGFSEDIIYCIGDSNDPLICQDFSDDGHMGPLCNLQVFQPEFGPLNTQIPVLYSTEESCFTDCYGNQYTIGIEDTLGHMDDIASKDSMFYQGHRIRPFHASYNGESLCIQINKTHNVKLGLYSQVARTGKQYLDDIDFCNEDAFPEEIDVYAVSYEKPDGIAYVRRAHCQCTKGCDVCQMREVPICLDAIDPVSGEFYVVPIVNVAHEGEPCCWQATSWGECCQDLYGDLNPCGCEVPVVICINYLASACGNWQDCCIPDDVCEDLKASVAYLATGMFANVCDCGCLDDIFAKYSMDMMLELANARSGSILYANEKGFHIFGQTRGAYEAYNQIRFRNRIHTLGDWFIG